MGKLRLGLEFLVKEVSAGKKKKVFGHWSRGLEKVRTDFKAYCAAEKKLSPHQMIPRPQHRVWGLPVGIIAHSIPLK